MAYTPMRGVLRLVEILTLARRPILLNLGLGQFLSILFEATRLSSMESQQIFPSLRRHARLSPSLCQMFQNVFCFWFEFMWGAGVGRLHHPLLPKSMGLVLPSTGCSLPNSFFRHLRSSGIIRSSRGGGKTTINNQYLPWARGTRNWPLCFRHVFSRQVGDTTHGMGPI